MGAGPKALILVADDNAENRAVAQATLEDEGYDVALAEDGEQAVAAFSERSPDCVLLDIKMPKLDGVAACRQIRALPDLAALGSEVVDALRARADGAGVTLVADMSGAGVHADRDLLRRVLENLVDNAIRHAPEGSAVRLEAARTSAATELRVADAGSGVPVDQR